MDEEYWVSYRRRARRRANSVGALILCPFGILVSIFWFLGPMDHPPGDIRDVLAFRLVVSGLFIVFFIAGIVTSARWLLADRRRD